MTVLRNTILQGDCLNLLPAIPAGSVDFILTDPPYLVRYRDRSGRAVLNDDNDAWLEPSAREMYRVLKPDAFCVSFYGWTSAGRFLSAWQEAGFRPVGHLVFRMAYASRVGNVISQHDCAYLLAKGRPARPASPIPDVIDFPNTGNRLHPTQKPVRAMRQLIECFTKPGDLVLDPFCGSGSTLVAARGAGRDWLGMELCDKYQTQAAQRVQYSRVAP